MAFALTTSMWETLQNCTGNVSLTKQCLTQGMYENLRSRKTKFGGTFDMCIRPGCENSHSWAGCVATDPDAYSVYQEFFDPIIRKYHNIETISHPLPYFGDPPDLDFADVDPDHEYILSTRVRVGRSHEGFGFAPVLSMKDRQEMEERTKLALETLSGELQGTYFPLSEMSVEKKNELIENHYLFRENDSVLRSSGVYTDWPKHRGIFYNDEKTFLVWVNEEDHIRLISMQFDGNLQQTYARLVKVKFFVGEFKRGRVNLENEPRPGRSVEVTNDQTSQAVRELVAQDRRMKAVYQLEKTLNFARDENLGYLAMCPSNLGTTLRASVHIKLPKLSAQNHILKATCDGLGLQIRGQGGAYTETSGDVCDLSNKGRLCLTEEQAVLDMKKGVTEIIKLEKSL